MKKFLAILLSVMLVMTLGICAFAAVETGDASITITRDPSYASTATGNETYTYYRILFADIGTLDDVTANTGELANAREGKVTYYVTSATEAAALRGLTVNDGTDDVPLFTVTPSADGTRHNVELAYTSASGEQIATALETVKSSFPSGGPVTRNGANDVEIENVVPGYYLIESSLGNKLAVQTLGEVTIKEKNTYPSIDKKQDDTATNPTYSDDDVTVAVGDTISYQVTVTVPATAEGDITVTDTMSSGLHYNGTLNWAISSGTISADVPAADPDPAVTNDYVVGTATSPETWVATIHANDNTRGKTITITYTATVTADALTDTAATNARENNVQLDYSNYHQEDEVYYNTKATGAVKYDGDTADCDPTTNVLTEKVAGAGITYLSAKFQLQESDGTVVPVVYDSTHGYYRPIDPTAGETSADGVDIVSNSSTGQIIIRGLDGDKSYKLVETEAPTGGYNLLTEPASLVLTDDVKPNVSITSGSNTDTVYLAELDVRKIENNKGSQLPSTGGIGTTIFYIVGAILVLGAGILIIAKRRSAAAEQ